MSFGFSLGDGAMEWAGDGLDTVFAQRTNLLRPRFVRGVLDILRFNRLAAEHLADGSLASVSLGDWLERERFSPWLRDCYVLPMGGAIWSTPIGRMLDFPAESFCAFFRNHDLLGALAERQRWRTVTGGSRTYVERVLARLGPRAVANTAALSVTRKGGTPRVRFSDGSEAVFDQVILACHGPQALALLSDADAEERATLGAFRTSPNRAVLHSDAALMPRRRKVWSSWNFLSGGPASDQANSAPVTYWMNRLQNIDRARPLFLSLNSSRDPDPATIHAEFDYAHPVMDGEAFAAQARMGSIQGRAGVWHAGAWLGYGFHEDGLRAGLNVASALGARPAWARDVADAPFGAMAEAAE
jgi:predicted NAD/FAD-binding protein